MLPSQLPACSPSPCAFNPTVSAGPAPLGVQRSGSVHRAAQAPMAHRGGAIRQAAGPTPILPERYARTSRARGIWHHDDMASLKTHGRAAKLC